MLQGQGVQLVHRHVHKGGHLVNKGAGAAGAGAVHPLLQGAAEEDDLGVLAAQLDYGVGVGDVGVHRSGGSVDLLDEVDAGGIGHAQTGGAGDGHLNVLSGEHILNGLQGLTGTLTGFGEVSLIGAEEKLVLLIQHHDLDGGGADVNSNAKTHSENVHLEGIIIQSLTL